MTLSSAVGPAKHPWCKLFSRHDLKTLKTPTFLLLATITLILNVLRVLSNSQIKPLFVIQTTVLTGQRLRVSYFSATLDDKPVKLQHLLGASWAKLGTALLCIQALSFGQWALTFSLYAGSKVLRRHWITPRQKEVEPYRVTVAWTIMFAACYLTTQAMLFMGTLTAWLIPMGSKQLGSDYFPYMTILDSIHVFCSLLVVLINILKHGGYEIGPKTGLKNPSLLVSEMKQILFALFCFQWRVHHTFGKRGPKQ